MKNIRVGMRVLVARWGILVGLVGCADGGVPVEDGGDVIDVIDVIDAGNYGSGVGCRVAGVQTCAGGASYGIYVTGISGYGAATNTFPVSGGDTRVIARFSRNVWRIRAEVSVNDAGVERREVGTIADREHRADGERRSTVVYLATDPTRSEYSTSSTPSARTRR
jgi:L-aminopeptidase/D-esterase-like protein